MLKNLITITSLFCASISFTQYSFFQHSDTLNKKRTSYSSIAVGSVWSGSMIGLWQFWYKHASKTDWHSFDDSKNWLQMDKAGHFYTAYKLNQLNTELFEWSGVSDKTSLLIGSSVSFGYQATLEILDARTVEWGFSWSDLIANTIGTCSYAGQKLAWNEERIIPKFSFAPTPYAQIRPNILGHQFHEQLLKDYNGQTYWLSFSPGSFLDKPSKIPKWLCISLGYSVDAKLVGSEELYVDSSTGKTYQSRREFKCSLDIDFSRIPIKRPWLKMLVKQLNYLKVPFPSLILEDNQLKGSWTGF